MGTIVTAYLSSFSHLKSKLLISCKLSLPFMPIFCYMGHTMSQIRIYLLSFVSGIKSGLFTLLVICRLNWKSQTSFTLPFSKTIPCSHPSLYHTVSFRIDLCSFAQVTTSNISALLCIANYLLLDKMMHTSTNCSTVSSYPRHTRHLLSSVSPRDTFQDLLSTICSSIDMIDDVFCGSRFWVSQR